MILEVLSRRWERKAAAEVLRHMHTNKQQEREKLLDTMLALASRGQLTSERMSFFLTALWGEEFESTKNR